MTVLAWDPMQQFTQQLLQASQAYAKRNTSFGMILASCSTMNSAMLDPLQTFLRKREPELSTQYFWNDHARVLGVMLEDQKLAGTHYTSLLVKECLDRHGLLDGRMVVASFPESGEPTDEVLSQLFQTATHSGNDSGEIQLFVDQPEKKGISTVLVVDSEEVSREFVRLRLELQGYMVVEAKNGSEAFDKIEQFSPDLVITELNLPIIDGYQLIRKMKEDHHSRGKVIVLTDKHSTKDMSRAFALGVADYVTKPFSISELEWRIRKLEFS